MSSSPYLVFPADERPHTPKDRYQEHDFQDVGTLTYNRIPNRCRHVKGGGLRSTKNHRHPLKALAHDKDAVVPLEEFESASSSGRYSVAWSILHIEALEPHSQLWPCAASSTAPNRVDSKPGGGAVPEHHFFGLGLLCLPPWLYGRRYGLLRLQNKGASISRTQCSRKDQSYKGDSSKKIGKC